MPRMNVRWYRIFTVYFALTALCLAAGCFAPPQARNILLVTGACLMGAFVPIIMAIYFMRGFLGNQ